MTPDYKGVKTQQHRTPAPDGKASGPNDKRSTACTEQTSSYDNLETKSTHEILNDISTEDHKVAEAVAQAIPQIERLVNLVVERMRQGGRLFYVGAGTSGRLGVLDASELPPTFGVPADRVIALIAGGDTALRHAVEDAEDDAEQGWKDLQSYRPTAIDTVTGIAASGHTPYVVGALKACRDHGIPTACITNNPRSPITFVADVSVEIPVGPEYITGSTRMKSGTAEKMTLNMLSTAIMIKLGRVKGNRMVNMQLTNQKLVDRGTRIIAETLDIDYDRAHQILMAHGSVNNALKESLSKQFATNQKSQSTNHKDNRDKPQRQ